MSTAIAKTEIKNVGAVLEKMKPLMAAELPKHLTPERMVRVALAALANTPKLLECDRDSLYKAVLQCCRLGLEPDGIMGQAYLIPFKGKVQFIPGYKGLIDLARRSGEVLNIIAKEVCENDHFDVDFSQDIPFVHKPCLTGERGEVRFFWAMARFKDGGFHWDYMTVAEVTAIRDSSSGWQSAKKFGSTAESPWGKHFIEMGKKTVIRRIAKYLPMSVQRAAMIQTAVDSGKHAEVGDYGELIIEGTAEEVAAEPINSKLEEFAGSHDAATGEVMEPSDPAPAFELTGEVGIREDLIVYPDTDSSGVVNWEKWKDDAGAIINALNSEADLDAFRTANEMYVRAIMKEAPAISRANDAVYVARRKALKAA